MKRIIALCALAGVAAAALAQPAVTVIVRPNTFYPTLPPGTVLGQGTFDRSVDPSGAVVFTGSFLGPAASGGAVVLVNSSGPHILAMARDPAPGASPGQVFCQFEQAQALANGVSVTAKLSNTVGACGSSTYANYRFFLNSPPQPIAIVGLPLFGITGSQLVGLANHLGHTAAAAYCLYTSTPAGPSGSIWAGLPQDPLPIARAGDSAPGLPGFSFTGFHGASLRISASGKAVFRATAASASESTSGLWKHDASGLSLLTETTLNSPAYPGRSVELGYQISINAFGQLALSGMLADAQGAHSIPSFWQYSNGTLLPIAVLGEPAPGTRGVFTVVDMGFPGAFDFNEAGEVAFVSGVSDANGDNNGLWAGTPGNLRLVARQGVQVPGLPPGCTFAELGFGHAINNRGQVAFLCRFRRPDLSYPWGICIADRGREPVLIVASGDPIPGSTETFGPLSMGSLTACAGGQDGLPTIFNDSGRLVFSASALPSTDHVLAIVDVPPPCYANCDYSNGATLLTANDFICFLTRFANQSPYANCDGSTTTPALTANDFQCFINKYAAGCS